MAALVERRADVFSLARFENMVYPDHLHPQLEVIVPARGSMSVQVDGRLHRLQAGEALLVFPNHLHSYAESRECSGLMLIFSPSVLPDLAVDWQSMKPISPVIASLSEDARYAAGRLCAMEPTNELNLERRALVHLLMAGLMQDLPLAASGSPVEGDLLFEALGFMAENYRGEVSLRLVARRIGCNEYYLSHLFNARLGIGFRQYVNLLRLDDAVRMIARKGMTMQEIADRCGFASLRSFDRAFRARYGCTPTQYRAGS